MEVCVFLFSCCIIPQTVYCWGSILAKKELATLTGRAPELCGWALCPGLVLLLSSVAGLCSVSRPCPPLVLCGGWALCPGLVLLLSSVAGLCVPPLGRP